MVEQNYCRWVCNDVHSKYAMNMKSEVVVGRMVDWGKLLKLFRYDMRAQNGEFVQRSIRVKWTGSVCLLKSLVR